MQEKTKDTLTQEQFIALFLNTRFRYIHDVTGHTITGSNVLDMSFNKRGYGIFYSVNGFPPTGKADWTQLLSLNGNYVDFDVDPKLSQEEKESLIQEALMSGIEAGIPVPTIINRTQKGAHLIWLYAEKMMPTRGNIEKWKDVQKRLVNCFKGDKNAVDPSRVLRLPYTMHLKDPKNPFVIKVTSHKSEARYSLEELNITVPKNSNKEIENNKMPAMEILLKGVPIGQGLRHGALMQIAGLLLRGVNTSEGVTTARENYYNWDQKIVGSPERAEERKKELDNIFNAVLGREISNKETETRDGTSASNSRLWSVGDILTEDLGEESWLVESLISKQGITALSGNPGDYKTWTSIHIALCVCRNLLVFGKFKVTQGNVLIIDEEDHIRLLKKRLQLLGAKETDNIYYLSQSGIKVDKEADRDMIIKIIKEKDIKLLILDSLIRVHGQEENAAGGMAMVFRNIQKMIGAGVSVLFTHHHRKQQGNRPSSPGQSMRGSSDILAAVDCHTLIEREQNSDVLVIKQSKLRQGELLPPFEVNIIKGESGPSDFVYSGAHDMKKEKAVEVSETLLSVLQEGMKSRTEILEILKEEAFGKTSIEDGIGLAESSGKIERVPKEELQKADRKKAFYRLPSIPNTNPDDDIIEDDELPDFCPPIETGKQEDEIAGLFGSIPDNSNNTPKDQPSNEEPAF